MSVYVEIKYASYVTTEVNGEVDFIDQEVWPPEAVLVGGERVPLNISDNLGSGFVEYIQALSHVFPGSSKKEVVDKLNLYRSVLRGGGMEEEEQPKQTIRD